jgi:hypothetical protein
MRAILITLGVVLGSAALLVAIFAGGLITNYNYAVGIEEQIEAKASDNEQVLSSFYNQLEETVQVTDIYAEDFRESMTAMLAGRYGDQGSRAGMQWIQEAMPNLDPSMYQEVQRLIRTERTNFQSAQTMLVDLRRQYNTRLRSFPDNIYLGMLGFPKLNLDDPRYNPVVSGDARQVFDTGVEEARNIRDLQGTN